MPKPASSSTPMRRLKPPSGQIKSTPMPPAVKLQPYLPTVVPTLMLHGRALTMVAA